MGNNYDDHTTDSNLIIHVFVQFLAARGALINWLDGANNNCEQWGVDDTIRCRNWHRNSNDIILGSFITDDTLQGRDYWCDINDEWEETYIELTRKISELTQETV